MAPKAKQKSGRGHANKTPAAVDLGHSANSAVLSALKDDYTTMVNHPIFNDIATCEHLPIGSGGTQVRGCIKYLIILLFVPAFNGCPVAGLCVLLSEKCTCNERCGSRSFLAPSSTSFSASDLAINFAYFYMAYFQKEHRDTLWSLYEESIELSVGQQVTAKSLDTLKP